MKNRVLGRFLLAVLPAAALAAAAAGPDYREVTLYWLSGSQYSVTNPVFCDGLLSAGRGKGMQPHPLPKEANKWVEYPADDDASGKEVHVREGQEVKLWLRNSSSGERVSFTLQDENGRPIAATELAGMEGCGAAWQKVKYSESGSLSSFNSDFACSGAEKLDANKDWKDHICVKVPVLDGGAARRWKMLASPAGYTMSNDTGVTALVIDPAR
ncbi:MAG: hypothetical protein HY077_07475 [Elusimicrobia bacterium]|nr:hypothetical protein [Elusimicrobiota bacterium]